MTTRTFTADELEELNVPWGKAVVSKTEIEQHRWYTRRAIVFEHQGSFWRVQYLDPATECQEDQDRWDDPSEIVATMVFRARVTADAWFTEPPITTPALAWLFDLVSENTADMDDGDSPPFGMYPETEHVYGTNTMIVRPDQDPDHWEFENEDGETTPGVVPDGPVIRITVERIR